MSAANRAANRLLLGLVGLLLLAVGAVCVVAVLPATAARTREVAGQARDQMGTWLDQLGGTTVHALVLALAAVVLVLALVALSTHGRRRTAVLRDADPVLPGTIELTPAFLDEALQELLGSRPELAAVETTLVRERARTLLVVRAEPRAGADPRAVIDAVADAVAQLDALLDRRVPVLLRLTRGVRRTFSAPDRVH